MFSKRYSMICREGISYLFVLSFIVGSVVLREVNLLVILAGMMIGLLVFNWRLVKMTLRGIRVRRGLPERVCAGDTFTIDVIADNIGRWFDSWLVVVKDRIGLENAPGPEYQTKTQVLISHVPVRGSGHTSYRCMLNRRGRYHFGPMTISTRFPLGFIQSGRMIEHRDTLLVCPQLGRLRPDWANVVEAMAIGNERSLRHRGFDEGEHFGLREWHAGDNKRWIHWRASAKLNELTVREFQQRRNRDLALVLDLWKPDSATQQQLDNIETAVSFAATVVTECCQRDGGRMTLSIAGQTENDQPAIASQMLLVEAMGQLAVVDGQENNQLDKALTSVLESVATATRVVVISTRFVDLDQLMHTCRLNSEAECQATLARMKWIDVGSEAFTHLFEIKN